MILTPLEDLRLWQRIALAIGIVVVALLALMFISWLVNEPAEGAQAQNDDIYADIEIDPELLRQDKVALLEAYHDQIKHLWSIYVKGQAHSTVEITNGLRIARKAYGEAAKQIEKREQRQDYQLHRDQGQAK